MSELESKINQETPIIVFQMGKVASSSIYQSLKRMKDREVYHVHRMNPESINAMTQQLHKKGLEALKVDVDGLTLYEQYISKRKPVKIITLVREPISRNMSAYFQNLEEYEGDKQAFSKLEVSELISGFMEKYNHQVPLRWFDNEFKAALGVDVFKHKFKKKQGHQRITEGPFDILIFRHDLDNRIKEQELKEFLETDDLKLSNANQGDNKIYGDVYKSFRENIIFPCTYIDEMLNAKYTNHFYTQDERADIRKKWNCI